MVGGVSLLSIIFPNQPSESRLYFEYENKNEDLEDRVCVNEFLVEVIVVLLVPVESRPPAYILTSPGWSLTGGSLTGGWLIKALRIGIDAATIVMAPSAVPRIESHMPSTKDISLRRC